MIRIRLIIVFIAFQYISFSQGINNLWLMGYDNPAPSPFGGIIMDFFGSSLGISYQSRLININCTNGLISNSNGDLLFVSKKSYFETGFSFFDTF